MVSSGSSYKTGKNMSKENEELYKGDKYYMVSNYNGTFVTQRKDIVANNLRNEGSVVFDITSFPRVTKVDMSVS